MKKVILRTIFIIVLVLICLRYLPSVSKTFADCTCTDSVPTGCDQYGNGCTGSYCLNWQCPPAPPSGGTCSGQCYVIDAGGEMSCVSCPPSASATPVPTPVPTSAGGGGTPPPPPPPPASTPTPIPVALFFARGHTVTTGNLTCDQLSALPATTPTTWTLTPEGGSKIQTDATYVNWIMSTLGTYTLSGTPPAGYVARKVCWWKSASDTGQGFTVTANQGDATYWDVGYSLGSPWQQTQGGDVYATTSLNSQVGSGAVPQKFNLDGTGGFPGVVTYGSDYNFNTTAGDNGATLVSSTNWLANETYRDEDYYQVFYKRLGSPTTPDSFADLAAVNQPASRATPYYVVGNMTTSGDWNVTAGQNVIFIVDGNLTIGGKINITGSGFVAFIVKGDISVASSVGGLYTDSTPQVEGIYMNGASNTFHTGTSSVVGKERLVVKGIVVAGNFALERDLVSVSQNSTTPAELFIYNPALLVTMPDAMKDLPVTWQEVAP